VNEQLVWQFVLMGVCGLVGSFLGAKITVAKLETLVQQHDKELDRLRATVSEHEGTLSSHSIQLAVLDRGQGHVR
jgi:hypothetical protein